MSKKPLNVLILEDTETDAELMVRELRRSGYAPEWKRVQNERDFSASLNNKIDIILSDYAMPGFDGMRALELLKKCHLDIPFIIVSGTIGEEIAVRAMRKGAVDYLLKDRLARLGQAVEHALEQKRAEQEFKTLSQEHKLILNCVGDGIHGINLEGTIIFENPKSCELLGYKPEELIGKPAHPTMHHSHSDGTAYPIDECPIYASMRDGATRRVTNDVFWRKDGSSFRVDYVAAAVRDAKGNIRGSIVTFKDISEQFAAEQRLKLQEEQYRLLFQTNPNPMWVFDSKTLQILAVNEAATRLYGYSKEEFLKLKLTDLRRPEERAALMNALSAPHRPAHFSGEFHHLRKDGSSVVVEIYSSPVSWDGIAARMVTAIDVTDRRRAQERLREQANIIDRASDAIIMRNYEDEGIIFWNKGAERLLGWTAEERVGSAATALAEPERISEVRRAIKEHGEFHGELKVNTKDGRELVLDVRETVVHDDAGNPRSLLIVASDVTEQKKLETQLLRAQRLESIGTLASGVAHDLNNVLTPIMMCSDILPRYIKSPDGESTIKLIQESARRGAAIVKQVLTFARGVEGERVLIKPSHLIDEMIDIAKKTFPKLIDVSSRYPEDLWTIEGDPTQLHQVLLNLSVNARDAMPSGGSIVIWAENVEIDANYAAMMPGAKPGAYVAIRVSDTGSGMSRTTVEKIFDPFFTTKEIGKGTGLGLSTALGIVKSHGGFISVYSELEKGTTFKIFLPAILSDENVRKETSSPELLHGNGELIMVVDDEQSILDVTQMILENKGYRIVTAHDGPEALALFAQQLEAIGAVLTDMALPFMDGVALVRSLKKMKPQISVIASTGQSEHVHATELAQLGVTNLLTKPYDTQKLLEALRAALVVAEK